MTLWAACALIYWSRYPLNLSIPNFFAEDATVFQESFYRHTAWSAIFRPFNGYFVVGLYLLMGLARLLNAAFSAGEMVSLPKWIAIVSYGFLGVVAAFSYTALRNVAGRYFAGLTAIGVALIPLANTGVATVGTIGNLKFQFLYLAALLINYRISLPVTARRIVAVDCALAVCLFTTASCYLLLPFLLACDGLRPRDLSSLRHKPRSGMRVGIVSAGAMLVVGLWQIIFVARHGVPALPGYLDAPFVWANAVEMILSRGVLFGIVPALYPFLNDVLAILIFAALAILGVAFSTRTERIRLALFAAGAFGPTLLLARARSGLSTEMNHYLSTGGDHFFMGQNACALAAGVLVLAVMFRGRRAAVGGVVAAAMVGSIAYADVTHPGVRGFFFDVPPIGQALQIACSKDGPMAFFDVYPITGRGIVYPKSEVCTPAVAQQPIILEAIAGRGTLAQALEIHPGKEAFRQTFKAKTDRLSGLFLFVGTFGHTFYKGYHLFLMDETCTRTIVEGDLPHTMEDGWELVTFPPILDSEDRTYCFSVSADVDAWQNLVLYLSTPRAYGDGSLTIGGVPSDRTIVSVAYFGR